ncbi:hypothetical protein [Aequorivita sp. Q41]|uniref:hypothetical protein n=1 Tax=Aequorivita sp. Q41 TaxID=3153300 RepID=UPI003241D8F7
MKTILTILVVAIVISGCGTVKTPKTDRQLKDRILNLEYKVHVRDREILRLKSKLENCN